MSTSAKFTFLDTNDAAFVYHDCYFSGVAQYLIDMCANTWVHDPEYSLSYFSSHKGRGSMLFNFVRGVPNAEYIEVSQKCERNFVIEKIEGRMFINNQPMVDFINQYNEDGVVFVEIDDHIKQNKVIVSVEEAQKAAEWWNDTAERFSDDNPNKPTYLKISQEISDVIEEI